MQNGEVYIGSEYDVTAAQDVVSITKDGSEYIFDHDYQDILASDIERMARGESVSYKAEMPADGVLIVRVYKQVEITYYYQVKYVFTAYDPDGNITYSGMEQEPVAASDVDTMTISAPDTYMHQEQMFTRNGEAEQTADLTGSTEERPYVFVVNYEIHEEKAPVQEEEITTLPPQTGDDGVGMWLVLMLLATAGMVLLMAKEHKRQQ
jgi:hypothetical protein